MTHHVNGTQNYTRTHYGTTARCSALSERSTLVKTALSQSVMLGADELKSALAELKELKHAFISDRTKQAFAASLASREPFADLDRSHRAAGTCLDYCTCEYLHEATQVARSHCCTSNAICTVAALSECKVGLRAAKDAVETTRADVSTMCGQIAVLNARLEGLQRSLADDVRRLEGVRHVLQPLPRLDIAIKVHH